VVEPVVCRACGAKIKEGRPTCLRCGEPLVSADEPRRPRWWERFVPAQHRAPLLVAGSILSMVVLLGIAATFQPGAPVSPAQPAGPQVSQPAVAPAAPAEPRSEAVPPGGAVDPPFLDISRGGISAYSRGDLPAALERFQQAVQKGPSDLESLNNLGQVLVRLGRAADAVPYFERAIALDQSRWASRFNLARANGEMGDWTRAVAEYRRASELFPDDYVTHYNLALALRRAGQEESTAAELRRAVELAPAETTFRLSLALSYERLNRPADAAAAYRQYLDLAPDAADAAKVKARLAALSTPERPSRSDAPKP
jgi:tetratricopeptide (TPR) repeat protein